jgi:hypothetical protein
VDSIQPKTHSFIVKVWVNDAGQAKGQIVWQGRIPHVPSGHVRHFVNVDEIAGFVLPYLHQLGVKPTWSWKIRHRLRRDERSRNSE